MFSLPVNRTRAVRFVLAVGVSIIAMVLVASRAMAVESHAYSSSFGSFTNAAGVAVDNSTGPSKDDVYVVDNAAGTVERYTPSQATNNEAGTPLTGAVLSAPYGVAVDDSNDATHGDVYVTDPAADMVDRFSGSTGSLETSFEGSEAPHTRSFEPEGIAVDPASGDVFVTDAHNGVVDVFTAAGKYVAGSQFGGGVLSSPNGIAIDSKGDAYVTNINGPAYEFTAESGYTSVFPITETSDAVTIDPATQDIYVDTGSEIDALNANNESVGSFGAGSLSGSSGVGVQSMNASTYASNVQNTNIYTQGETPAQPTTGKTGTITSTTAILEGTLNAGGGGATEYYFIYSNTGKCTDGEASNRQTGANGTIQTEISNLTPNTTYTYCLVASNMYGSTTGAPMTLTTSTTKPTIVTQTIVNVEATVATLTAQIDTQNTPVSYYYEYDTGTEMPRKTTEGHLEASNSNIAVTARLTGLQPASEYEFTLTTTNTKNETTKSETLTFHTLSVEAPGLSDNRVYEMVTPVENEDANVYVPKAVSANHFPLGEDTYTRRPFQAAINGNSVVYIASPTHGGVRSGLDYGDQYMATRSPNGGWTQTNMQPFGFTTAAYQAFSSDLSMGVLAADSEGPGSSGLPGTDAPEEDYNVLYTRTVDGGIYHPFFTTRPPNRSASQFEAYNVPQSSNEPKELAFAGASEDFSRLFFEANDALQGASAVDGGPSENNLYESSNGQLSAVNILPGQHETSPNATFGAPALEEPTVNSPDFDHAISSDGSRAYWTDLNTNDLYLSENIGSPEQSTVQVDASQAGGTGGGGRFWTASSDGSKAFLTDNAEAGLTTNTLRGSGENLYEYETGQASGQAGKLTDLTPQPADGTEIGVLGVLGASENGETIYFVATGILTKSENVDHKEPVAGADNLYMIHPGDDPVFIGALSLVGDDQEMEPFEAGSKGGYGDWQPGVGHRTAEVTPNGRSLVFMSQENLTGYPNEVNGERLEEVYLYEAEGSHLSCISCNPSGAAAEPNALASGYRGVAAFLPISWSNTYLPQWMSDNGGRVFFDSDEPLVLQDTNGKQDVYEWEHQGEGTCTQAGGCIYLLSGGVNESASWFEGMSADGSNVFIATRAQLVPEDKNENFDLYDVRVDGVQPVAPPECQGTGCQGVPSPPPTFATPPSVTFEGVGNFPPLTPVAKPSPKSLTRAQKLAKALKVCRGKRSERKRAICEAGARKRYGSLRSRSKRAAGGKVAKGKKG